MAKVLIAEDEYVTQKKVAKIVENLGHVAFISPDGKHAFETLKVNDGFKLLITDMMMPEMDGRALVEAVRKNEKTKDMPIILMSAYVSINEIKGLLKMGVTYFLPKPIKNQDLQNNIEKCIKFYGKI